MTGASRKTTAREAANLGNQKDGGTDGRTKRPWLAKTGLGQKRKKKQLSPLHSADPATRHDDFNACMQRL